MRDGTGSCSKRFAQKGTTPQRAPYTKWAIFIKHLTKTRNRNSKIRLGRYLNNILIEIEFKKNQKLRKIDDSRNQTVGKSNK